MFPCHIAISHYVTEQSGHEVVSYLFQQRKQKNIFFLIFKKGKKRKEKRSVGEGKTTRENAVPKLLP